MKKMRKTTAIATLFMVIFTMCVSTAFAASTAPTPANIQNYFNNEQQVILDNVSAKLINIQMIAVNLAVNVAPAVNVNVNLNLDNIGPK